MQFSQIKTASPSSGEIFSLYGWIFDFRRFESAITVLFFFFFSRERVSVVNETL